MSRDDGIAYKYDGDSGEPEEPRRSRPLVEWYEAAFVVALFLLPLLVATWLGMMVGAAVLGYRLIT